MRQILFSFLVLSLFFLSCKNKEQQISGSSEISNKTDSVLLSISPDTFSKDSKRISAILFNNTNDTIFFGRTLHAEYFKDGQWYYYNTDVLNDDLLSHLEPKKSDTLYVFLFPEEDEIISGTHRVKNTFWTRKDTFDICSYFFIK